MTAGLTAHIDLAQITLYLFWLFFAGLLLYLRNEDRREGYPLLSEVDGSPENHGTFLPKAKTYILPHGGTTQLPSGKADTRPVKGRPVAGWSGAPLEPTGDPLVDGIGPAAYAERSDTPDLTHLATPKIVPLRVEKGFAVSADDADPRGFTVTGADGRSAGTVADIWVDRSEVIIRYLEVDVAGAARRVLVPYTLTVIDGARRNVSVKSLLASQFAKAPTLKSPDQVTLLEEDKIVGFFGGGNLYAVPARTESLL